MRKGKHNKMTELSEYAYEIAKSRYFWDNESTWQELTVRVCRENAKNEASDQEKWNKEFYSIIEPMYFIPAGRILRNLGKLKPSTSNCNFLSIEDSIESIGETLKNYMIISSYGGGTGLNFSTLRPKGAPLITKGGGSSGPISFLEIFNTAGKVIETGGSRRSAGICIMDVRHPDIIDFINAKIKHNKLDQFNISVIINSEFLDAVEKGDKWEFRFAGKVYGEMKAKKIWDLILDNMLEHAEPGLINWDNLIKNNTYYFSPIGGTNPCSELMLSDMDCCNLGSLVLPKFIINKNTNWQLLSKTIKLAIRYLDNIIDLSFYPIQGQETVVKNTRRQGLGTMGLANYLFMKEMRYGSDRALVEIEKLYKFIRDEAYIASVELAMEKGSFPKFERTAFGNASFVRKLPAKIRMMIKDYGIRNSVLTTAPPTGCLVGDTIVASTRGCLKIKNYAQINHNYPIVLQSDFGKTYLRKFYDQGTLYTKKVYTKRGYSLQGTYNHKVRTVSVGGGYIWKEISDLKQGDIVVLKKDFIEDKPTWLRNDVSELLGFYMADGWWTVSGRGHRLYFEIHSKEVSYIINLLNSCFKDTFNINPIVRDRGNINSARIEVNSKKLYDWFKRFKCIKKSARLAYIPDIVLRGSRYSLFSFIRGFFLGDGGFNKQRDTIRFTTISDILALQLHTVLLGVGIPANLYKEKSIGKPSIIEGRIVKGNFIPNRVEISPYYSRKLCELISISTDEINSTLGRNFESVVLTPNELSLFFNRQMIKEKYIYYTTNYSYKKKVCESKWNWFIKNNLIIEVVDRVEDCGLQPVYDIEVDNNTHTYIANGFVTHNTSSLLADVVGGIEPLPFKGYRRVDGVGERIYVHPLCKDHFNEDWFVDSYDLEPEDHLNTQVLVQRNVCSGVSKTLLLPANATAESLSKLLLEYIKDLKGIAVYRDTSREKQVYYKLSKKDIKEHIKSSKTFQEMDVDDMSCNSGMCEI